MGIGSNEKNLKDLEGDKRYRFIKGYKLNYKVI
jgi:hypothetical protein